MSADAAVLAAFASLSNVVSDFADANHVDTGPLFDALNEARRFIHAAVDEQDAELIEVRRLLHYQRELAGQNGAMSSTNAETRTTDSLVLRAVTETLQPVVGHDLADSMRG